MLISSVFISSYKLLNNNLIIAYKYILRPSRFFIKEKIQIWLNIFIVYYLIIINYIYKYFIIYFNII